MQHLDEGTIHAWLDGELPAGEASRVEAHSASCTACAALVAEARGLIAASSRILSALDDVPGDVLPGKTTERVMSIDSLRRRQAPASRPLRRPWFARPQFMAAAAVVLVAVGTIVVTRGARHSTITELAAPVLDLTDSAKRATKARQAMEPGAVAASAPREQRSRDTIINAPVRANASASRASAAQPSPTAPRFAAGAAADAAPRGRPSSAAAEGAAGSAKPTRETATRRDAATPPASPAPAPPLARNEIDAAKGAADSISDRRGDTAAARAPRPNSLRVDEIVKQETARLRGERKIAMENAATGATVGAPSANAGRIRKTLTADDPRIATSAGCYRLAHSPDVQADSLPGSLRMVPERVERVEGSLAWRVTDNDESATPLPSWRWTVEDDGRIVLLRQSGTAWQRYPFVSDSALVAGRAVLAIRIECVRR